MCLTIIYLSFLNIIILAFSWSYPTVSLRLGIPGQLQLFSTKRLPSDTQNPKRKNFETDQ